MALLDPLLAGPLLGESIFSLAPPGPKHKWFGPQSGICTCCWGPCLFFGYLNELSAPKWTFESGTWSSLTNRFRATSIGGIAIANGETDGNGSEAIITKFSELSAGDSDDFASAYDILYDYIDAANYQVLKFRIVSGQKYAIFSQVDAGVETDLASYPVVMGFGNSTTTFMRNGSDRWAVTGGGVFIPGGTGVGSIIVPALPQYGGTRFGLRSNTVGDTWVDLFDVRNALETSVAQVVVGSRDYYTWRGSRNQKQCMVSHVDARCLNCIHLPPDSSEAQFRVTLGGITGTCGSLLNGTYYIDPGGSGFGYKIDTGSLGCGGTYGVPLGACNDSLGQGALISFTFNNISTFGGASSAAYPGVIVNVPEGFLGYYSRAVFELVKEGLMNCYTDLPKPLVLREYVNDFDYGGARVDFSGAVASFDIEYY